MSEDRSLLTVVHRVQLLVNALNAGDPPPVLKLFTPDANATWLIVSVDPSDPDRLFGLCDLGLGFPEVGYVSLKELTAFRGPQGLLVECDEHFVADHPFSTYVAEAMANAQTNS